ncbi:sugar-binding transcriptional regulator [Propionibacteriaceae bacterium G1746]|uniref:sugar-binding transcriptional regulator n=1 Tax=Aestuariimicrobium sp. G57 TaxID=3418485 RepID=UPI003C22D5F1
MPPRSGPAKSGAGDRDHLLLRVCQLHYEQHLTQQEVGERLHLTRWQVGRMLKEALAAGIVRIEIVHPQARSHDLETELVTLSTLTEAVVVPTQDDPAATQLAVARAAAEYLADLPTPPRTLAISWGRMMSALASAIPPSWADGVTVVQANGGLSRPGPGDPGSILTAVARQGRGQALFLQAPAIVDSPTLAAALRREPSIAEVLGVARSADVLVFPLGAVSHDSVLVKSGCVLPRDEVLLAERGAVGDIVGRFLDASGALVSPELEARAIGLTLDDVRAAKLSVAVVAGEQKHAVAEACVRAGLCNVLVTDAGTAQVLKHRLAGQSAGQNL